MARRGARSNATRAKARRRVERKAARRAFARSTSQMLAVLVGGAGAGGLAILAAFPATTEPVPPIVCLGSAAFVAALTTMAAVRLRPSDAQPSRGRR